MTAIEEEQLISGLETVIKGIIYPEQQNPLDIHVEPLNIGYAPEISPNRRSIVLPLKPSKKASMKKVSTIESNQITERQMIVGQALKVYSQLNDLEK